MTFIADERFQSFFVENTGIWTLQIKYVQVIYQNDFPFEPSSNSIFPSEFYVGA